MTLPPAPPIAETARTGRSGPGPRWRLARLAAVVALTAGLSACGISATSGWSGSVPGHSARKDINMSAPSGPVYPADLQMLVAVTQAGLWEGPGSELVAFKSENPRVRKVAAQLAREHHMLNAYNEAAARQLHVQLPKAATPQQQAWREQIEAAGGAERDRLYVKLTRAAHGSVYMAIASVRSTTQNDVVRTMADIASNYVSRHMKLLESTGLADLDSLAVHAGTDAPYQPIPAVADVILGVGLALLLGVAALVVVRLGSTQPAKATGGEPEE